MVKTVVTQMINYLNINLINFNYFLHYKCEPFEGYLNVIELDIFMQY